MSQEPADGSAPGDEQPPTVLETTLARVRETLHARHLSPRTESACVGWVRRFVEAFHGRDPANLGVEEVRAFLSDLASRDELSASTQNQAFSALLFLYRNVLGQKLTNLHGVVRARPSTRVPAVLTSREAQSLLSHMRGGPQLMGALLYGAGLRLSECCRLRVKDLDFERHEITVRDGKGRKDRVTLLPTKLIRRFAGPPRGCAPPARPRWPLRPRWPGGACGYADGPDRTPQGSGRPGRARRGRGRP